MSTERPMLKATYLHRVWQKVGVDDGVCQLLTSNLHLLCAGVGCHLGCHETVGDDGFGADCDTNRENIK